MPALLHAPSYSFSRLWHRRTLPVLLRVKQFKSCAKLCSLPHILFTLGNRCSRRTQHFIAIRLTVPEFRLTEAGPPAAKRQQSFMSDTTGCKDEHKLMLPPLLLSAGQSTYSCDVSVVAWWPGHQEAGWRTLQPAPSSCCLPSCSSQQKAPFISGRPAGFLHDTWSDECAVRAAWPPAQQMTLRGRQQNRPSHGSSQVQGALQQRGPDRIAHCVGGRLLRMREWVRPHDPAVAADLIVDQGLTEPTATLTKTSLTRTFLFVGEPPVM